MPIKRQPTTTFDHDHHLNFLLPHWEKLAMHGRHNGSLTIDRLPDGGAEISCRSDIHEWGSTETIRLDADAWRVVQAFVAGDPGGSYITPYRESQAIEAAGAWIEASRKEREE